MRVIRIERVTIAEAEIAIAMLWRVLEEYRIPTPKLNVYQVAGAVDLTIEFLSQQNADLVRRVASGVTAGALAIAAGSKLG